MYLYRFRFRRGRARVVETFTSNRPESPRMGRYICVSLGHGSTRENRIRVNKTVFDVEVGEIIAIIRETVQYALTESLRSVFQMARGS